MQEFGATTQLWREKLFGKHGHENQLLAQKEAERSLNAHGPTGWWTFEGYTSVDCYLETDDALIFVEGKRTEPAPSISTNWYAGRNQIVRNLEVARAQAQCRDYAVVVIAKDTSFQLTPSMAETSLPHLAPGERLELLRHYLGCITWKDLCEATGIDYSGLPNTVE